MTLQTLILLTLKISIGLSVFAIGLASPPGAVVSLFRRPAQLGRSLLAMNVVMPAFAAAIVSAFDLHDAVKVALVALAVSPVPPILPKKQIKARGEPSYAVGLLVAAAIVSVVFIPVAVHLLGRFFETPAHMRAWPIVELVLLTDLAPLLAGVLVRRFIPTIATRVPRYIALVAAVLLAASVAPLLFAVWPAVIALVDDGAIVAIAAFVLMGLAVGHALGGPDPHERVVLALAAATRHPGMAMAIGAANFPELSAVLPAILLYVALNAIFTIPYVLWRKRAASLSMADRPRLEQEL